MKNRQLVELEYIESTHTAAITCLSIQKNIVTLRLKDYVQAY